jgi:myo-inositol-1(or 4)-monophosphatase
MAAVEFGYVFDFGAGEEFVARRGAGATLGGESIAVGSDDAEKLELLGIESAEPEWALPALEALSGRVYRLRVVGSIAITVAYVAAARLDAMLSLRSCRSVDAAAAQLIVREAGGKVAFGDLALDDVPLGLDARYPIAAAAGTRSMAIARSVGS